MKTKKETAKKEPVKIDYENKILSVVYFMPLLLIAGFVPLIVYAKYIDLSGTTQSLYWTGQQQYPDFFSYWKSRWVIVLTMIGLVFYIILYVQKKLPFKNLKQYYIPLGIYAIFVVLSTMFAIDKQTAIWGFVDMYQGMFVLLSYVIITFLTINFVNNERDVKLFVKAFTFLMIVEGIFGITQYFGFDFFQTALGKKLIIPGNIQVENLSFSFGPKTIYGTLFNPNFVGSFATLMLPLAVAFLFTSKTKRQRIIAAVTVVLMIFVWIGCNSRAGYIGVATVIVFGIIIFSKIILRHWKVCFSYIALCILFFVVINFISGGKLLASSKSLNVFEEFRMVKLISEENVKFEEIKIEKDSFSIKTNFETLNLRIQGDKLFFEDESGNELNISSRGNQIQIKDERYNKYNIVMAENYPGVSVSVYWRKINFYFSEDGVKILGSGGRVTEPVEASEFKPLAKYGRVASNRFFIWSRSLPIIRKNIFVGDGPDNFPLSFPQDDFVAKLNVGMDANMVVDKPHNMYIQMAVNSGLLSLLALIVMWGIYIVSSLRIYMKLKYDSFDKYLGLACLLSVIGYLSTGIFNDQVISVAPLFWIILGVGISINLRIVKLYK